MGPGLELVTLLDEWEVMGLGDDIREGGIECDTCGEDLCTKKLIHWHGRNCHGIWVIGISVTSFR